MSIQILGVSCAAITLLLMYELLRRQSVKEKYTLLWIIAGLAMAMLALFPQLLDALSDLVRVKSGPNLLFLVGGLAITLICVQLSVEVSKLEKHNRALAEEVGLLRLQQDDLLARIDL